MSKISEHNDYDKFVFEQIRRWRIVREPILKDLDVQFLRALETNDDIAKAEIVSKKNALRNLTNYDFSKMENLIDILLYWPEILGDVPEEFKVEVK